MASFPVISPGRRQQSPETCGTWTDAHLRTGLYCRRISNMTPSLVCMLRAHHHPIPRLRTRRGTGKAIRISFIITKPGRTDVLGPGMTVAYQNSSSGKAQTRCSAFGRSAFAVAASSRKLPPTEQLVSFLLEGRHGVLCCALTCRGLSAGAGRESRSGGSSRRRARRAREMVLHRG